MFLIYSRRLFLFFFPTLFSFLLIGCGKRAEPVPPSLVVPEKVSELSLLVKPGERFLKWPIPAKNTDGSRPADLSAFRLYAKRLDKARDACMFCDEGFHPLITINFRRPEVGFRRGKYFYYDLPPVVRGKVDIYYVVSLNSRGWLSQPSPKLAVDWLPEIQPPTNLSTQTSASMVELRWEFAEPRGITADYRILFKVYRRNHLNDDSPWILVTPEPLAERSYIDVGLSDWSPYEYSVTTIIRNGVTSYETVRSRPVKVIPGDYTPPPKVSNLTGFPYQGGVQLVWDAVHSADLAGYYVYRQDLNAGVFRKIAMVSPRRHEFFDNSVVLGRRYIYWVTSFDRSDRRNESPQSQKIIVELK